MINEEKSQLDPHQVGEFLSYSVDLENGVFSVPQKKGNSLLNLLHDIRSQHKCVSARVIARVTGTIISMGLALGPVARLFSRHLYAVQNNVVCLSEQVLVSHYALSEIQFWIDNFAELVGQPMDVAFIPMYGCHFIFRCQQLSVGWLCGTAWEFSCTRMGRPGLPTKLNIQRAQGS